MQNVLSYLFIWATYLLFIIKISIFINIFSPFYGSQKPRDGLFGLVNEVVEPVYSLFNKVRLGPLDFSPMLIFLVINYLTICFTPK